MIVPPSHTRTNHAHHPPRPTLATTPRKHFRGGDPLVLARRGPYDAALDNELLHHLEYASFLVTAWLFWRMVIGTRGMGRVSHGVGVLLVFTMAMQSVFLSVLLTFARTP